MKTINIRVYRTTAQTYYAVERLDEQVAAPPVAGVQFAFEVGRFIGADEDEREAVSRLRHDARAEARRRKIAFVHGLDV